MSPRQGWSNIPDMLAVPWFTAWGSGCSHASKASALTLPGTWHLLKPQALCLASLPGLIAVIILPFLLAWSSALFLSGARLLTLPQRTKWNLTQINTSRWLQQSFQSGCRWACLRMFVSVREKWSEWLKEAPDVVWTDLIQQFRGKKPTSAWIDLEAIRFYLGLNLNLNLIITENHQLAIKVCVCSSQFHEICKHIRSSPRDSTY